jgi:hypothetical protein
LYEKLALAEQDLDHVTRDMQQLKMENELLIKTKRSDTNQVSLNISLLPLETTQYDVYKVKARK